MTNPIVNQETLKRSQKETTLKFCEVYFELKAVIEKAVKDWGLTEEKKTELLEALKSLEEEYQKVKVK